MERVSKKAVATSQPFRFLIGPLQTEYTIHSALVAHHSPALAAMVNGKFRESQEGSVKWDDVDEIVFNSFWQFVYTGDYDAPEPLPTTQKDSSQGDQKSDTAGKPMEKEPTAEAEAEAEAEAAWEALIEVEVQEAAELSIADAETDQEKKRIRRRREVIKSRSYGMNLSVFGEPLLRPLISISHSKTKQIT